MKVYRLPDQERNAILQSAMRVMSANGNSMDSLLIEADKLLNHDFVIKSKDEEQPTKAETQLTKLIWIEQCKYRFAQHFAKLGYPVEHWDLTIHSELSTYVGTGENDRWQEFSPEQAVSEQLSYWEP